MKAQKNITILNKIIPDLLEKKIFCLDSVSLDGINKNIDPINKTQKFNKELWNSNDNVFDLLDKKHVHYQIAKQTNNIVLLTEREK